MAGAVIENLSNRKLIIIIASLSLFEIIIVLVGGLYAPQPTHAIGPSSMQACTQKRNSDELITPKSCKPASLAPSDTSDVSPDDVVFVGMIPGRGKLSLIRWFQYLLCFANVRIQFALNNQVEKDALITMNLRLAYSNAETERLKDHKVWTEFAKTSEESRPLDCFFNYTKKKDNEGYEYDCDPLFIFQLGSVPHKRYLLNMKLPVNLQDANGVELNRKIGQVSEIELVSITQTGGFTYVWLGLKSFLFIFMIVPIVWFWRRVKMLARNSMLIEKACFALGLSMIFLNLPIEYITIVFDASWMLLFSDVRQGLFYAVLFSFWVVFTGEHLMDQAHRNKLSTYRCHLICICVTSFALLSFDVAERGAQLVNPFGTVWNHPAFGYTLLALGALSAFLYLILLIYLIFKVFRSIRYKRRFILQDERAARFRAIVSRLKHMMLLTLATALLTIVFFFLEQKLDGIVNEIITVQVEISSAFFFGVYGLWNIYVCVVLFMYAPSHKLYDVVPMDGEESEEHEMAALNQATEQSEILQIAQRKERED